MKTKLTKSERHQLVLAIIVSRYIETAKPVGSVTVCEACHHWSAATIRADMAALEEQGLLSQLHTSSGRIPTEQGLRRYIDAITARRPKKKDREQLDQLSSTDEVEDFPEALAKGLAGVAGQMAVVTVPKFMGDHFKEMGLARCGPGRFLAFFVSPGGLVQQKLVEVAFDLSPTELQEAQNYLNERLAGRTLVEVRREIEREQSAQQRQRDALRGRALAIGARALPEFDYAIAYDGAAHLANFPEFSDGSALASVLHAIGQREIVLELLTGVMDGLNDVTVLLSSEHGVSEMAELALVSGRWESGLGTVGSIALFGPSRMDYERAIPLVAYAGELCASLWQRI